MVEKCDITKLVKVMARWWLVARKGVDGWDVQLARTTGSRDRDPRFLQTVDLWPLAAAPPSCLLTCLDARLDRPSKMQRETRGHSHCSGLTVSHCSVSKLRCLGRSNEVTLKVFALLSAPLLSATFTFLDITRRAVHENRPKILSILVVREIACKQPYGTLENI